MRAPLRKAFAKHLERRFALELPDFMRRPSPNPGGSLFAWDGHALWCFVNVIPMPKWDRYILQGAVAESPDFPNTAVPDFARVGVLAVPRPSRLRLASLWTGKDEQFWPIYAPADQGRDELDVGLSPAPVEDALPEVPKVADALFERVVHDVVPYFVSLAKHLGGAAGMRIDHRCGS